MRYHINKKIIILCLFILTSFSLFSSPFGLKMGMTFDEITEASDDKSPILVDNDIYYIYPSKTHPAFQTYIAFIDKEYGLYALRAISDDILANRYGSEIKYKFREIKERIEKIYGSTETVDKIVSKTIWNSEEDWLQSLREGSRIYVSVWQNNNNITLKDDLVMVGLYGQADSYTNKGWIVLDYNFANIEKVQESQDDVF